jgi:hypothetical protein
MPLDQQPPEAGADTGIKVFVDCPSPHRPRRRNLPEVSARRCEGHHEHQLHDESRSAERIDGLHAAEASLLISIELLNIPSLTTLLPFRSPRFNTLRFDHRASRLLIPAVAFPPPGVGPHRGFLEVRGSPNTRRLPDRLGQIEFAFATDCSFDSSYSPPFLLKTQLLSSTGR